MAPTKGDEQAVLSKIYDITMASCKDLRGDNARLLVTRSRAAVTLFKHNKGAPIQVILSTYSSVEELLASFDVDAACCAYVLGTGQFVCSARGRRALEYRVNLIQSAHHSTAYVRRLEKYAGRGFGIGLPGLDVSLLSRDLLSASYVWIKKKDLLLRVLSGDQEAPGLSQVTMPSGSKVRDVRCRKQKASCVSGVQRLVVLSLAKRIREVDSPYVGKSTFSNDVVDGHNTSGPLLLHSEEKHDEYWLLWGVVAEDSDDDDDTAEDDDALYTVTPIAKAILLFDSCLKWQSERLGRGEEPSRADDWSRSGFIFRVSKSMKSSPHAAKSLVDNRIHTQLSCGQKLSFVYDFVDAARTLDTLNFVMNAAHRPLRDISEGEFLEVYGLPPRLSFTPAAERDPSEHNYWGEIYDGS